MDSAENKRASAVWGTIVREKFTAQYWRDRADEALAIAYGLRDPVAKRTMEQIAAGYANLAERAERAKTTADRVQTFAE